MCVRVCVFVSGCVFVCVCGGVCVTLSVGQETAVMSVILYSKGVVVW